MTSSNFLSNTPVASDDIKDLCRDPEQLHRYLWKSGLLGDFSGVCQSCSEGNVSLNKDGDNFWWRCGKRSCRKKISLTKGSFFEGSKLDIKTILLLIYYFLYKAPYELVANELKIKSSHTIVDWFNFCREVCITILTQDNTKIGGQGHVVEIDESKFGKRKYNRGRRVDGCWVLGGIDRTTRQTFFQIVPDRTKETLLPILLENIYPDSIVVSDCWRSYSSLGEHFDSHRSVNHSLNFVDPADKSVHTNSIESQWRVLKRSVLPFNGTSKDLYSSYFAWYCVSQKYLIDVPCKFKAFLELVKRAYRLDPAIVTPRTKSVAEKTKKKENTPPPLKKRIVIFDSFVNDSE